MTSIDALLLPGMDGTGELFAAFVRALPATISPTIARYPRDRPLGYEALADDVVAPHGPFAIIAESFSGPLAIMLAARHRDVRALVLVATFARSPRFSAKLGAMFGETLFRALPPRAVLRWAMLDAAASDDEVRELARVVASVPPPTMAARLRAIAGVDVRDELSRLTLPVLLVSGRRDRLAGPSMKTLRDVCPRARSVALDAPHLVLQRAPVESAAVISAFLHDALVLPLVP